MKRVSERQVDALIARALKDNRKFSALFLTTVDGRADIPITEVNTQTSHKGRGNRGSIDIELMRSDGSILLIENKINAAFSTTRTGATQPERYQASVKTLRQIGKRAASVLLAPKVYLDSTRHSAAFDHHVSYEAILACLVGIDFEIVNTAIAQASAPYNPIPNRSSAEFFTNYQAYARRSFPELVIKRNPNGKGERATGSRTIYFDVTRTLRKCKWLPRPTMSLQCRDSAAPSASVKIMLTDWATKAENCKRCLRGTLLGLALPAR